MKSKLKFLQGEAPDVARRLIGWQLIVTEADGSQTGGTIIEAEAYSQDDAASHSFRGRTPRTEIMFGPAGGIYVYFTYGMHWCMNIVTGSTGRGEAVLIRAIEPELGVEKMRQRRHGQPDALLTNGPAKLCQALGVTGADNGLVIGGPRFSLLSPTKTYKVTATKRVGIKRDTHRMWRFVGYA